MGTPWSVGLNMRGLNFETPEPSGDIAASDPAGAIEDPAASWAPSREEWERTQEFLSQAGPLLGQIANRVFADPSPAPQQDPSQGGYAYDPFDENSVADFIEARISAGLEQGRAEMLGPMEPLLGHIAEVEGERLARAELSAIQEELGEFDHDQAVLLAQGLLRPGVDPSAALRYAAQTVVAYEKGIREDERKKYEEFLRTKGGAPPAEGASGAAAGEEDAVPTGPQRYEIAVRRALARRNAVYPGG